MSNIANIIGEKAHLVTYTGAGATVVSGGFDLSDAGVVVGIVVSIVGLIAQIVFKLRHDRREELKLKSKIDG
ncbi:MAG: hypothetical protein ACRBHB_18195 [Arenicella sp.]